MLVCDFLKSKTLKNKFKKSKTLLKWPIDYAFMNLIVLCQLR